MTPEAGRQADRLLRADDELNLWQSGQNCCNSAINGKRPASGGRGIVIGENLMKQLLIGFLLVSTLTLVQAKEAPSSQIEGIERNGSDCIWIRTVRDYTSLDDQNLLIRGSGKRSYLVTLLHPSFELRSSMGLGFSSRDDQLCPFGGDGVVFEGLSRETVRIRSISEVSSDQAEQLMVQFGRKEPKEQQTAAPKTVKGAEVEELD